MPKNEHQKFERFEINIDAGDDLRGQALSRILVRIDQSFCQHDGGKTAPGLLEAKALWEGICHDWSIFREESTRLALEKQRREREKREEWERSQQGDRQRHNPDQRLSDGKEDDKE